MDLSELRNNIDKIDGELTKLFEERMKAAALIGKYKQENGLPIYCEEREKEVLDKVSANVSEDLKESICALYQKIFELSRLYQE